jgi:hypothetical protein
VARTVVLLLSLAIICLLAYLTVRVAIQDGVTVLVVFSGLLLALLGFGVLGALTSPPPDG